MTCPNLIAINVGNTRTQIGRCRAGEVEETARFTHEAIADTVQTIQTWWADIADDALSPAILMGSVNDPEARRLASMLQDQLSIDVYRVGVDVPIPIGEQLEPETLTGQDRLLNAAAAYDVVRQAVIVIDVGTAVTVDFVDGEGTFHGGAIAPGARMQLHALHEYTAALPDLAFAAPDDQAFGRNTAQAMLQGVFHGIRGLVWKLTERYAEAYGAFPTVIATGGDAETLFATDELVNHIVPDLTIRGIQCAARHAMSDLDASH
ncbi:MAG: type III pantothenate kinase, partial [Phycisphaerales bacterium]|nr:type III pantothenate kinase [Phycisphaerales bacterium]